MSVRIKLLFLIALMQVFLSGAGLGQTAVNQIILNPQLNLYAPVGQTLGGASVALTDSIPDIFGNPAKIAWSDDLKIFVSLTYGKTWISRITSDINDIQKNTYDNISVNSFVLSVPFRILNVPLSIAASYNSNNAYTYESDLLGVVDRFSAQMYMASLGIGLRPASKVRIGLGATRLIQKYQQLSSVQDPDQCSSLERDYHTNLYYIGLQTNPNKAIALGMTYYFPSEAQSENHASYRLEREYPYSGSLKMGLGYHLNDFWLMGIEYDYQWLDAYQASISVLSVGAGYTFSWAIHAIPVYISYKTILFSDDLNDQVSGSGSQILKYQQLGAGIGFQSTVFSLYSSLTWSVYGDYFNTTSLISPVPPWS